MAQFNGTVTDYNSAVDFLGGRQAKKLANNTYVHNWGDEVAVTLGTSTIVRYFASGGSVMSNCGYPTATSRQRLSELNPYWHYVQRNHKQYLQHKETHELVPFNGAVVLDIFGNVLENNPVT